MNLDIFKQEDKSGNLKKEKYVSLHYNDEYNYIINWCDINNLSDLSFKLKVYHCINNLLIIPTCKICNSIVKFKNSNIGYNTYCSIKCQGQDETIKNKRKKTNIIKYGTDKPQQLEIIKQKTKKTNQLKYGVDYPLLNCDIKEKAIITLQQNFGVDNPNKNLEILKNRVNSFKLNILQFKESYKDTSIAKYGTLHPWQNKIIHDKGIIKTKQIQLNNLKKLTLEKLINKKDILISIDENTRYLTLKCNLNHEYKIHRQLFYTRHKNNSCLCTICNPINIGVSGQELELVNFIKTNYDGKIILNDRTILKGKELDIYLPELNLAIEFNGLYWHSELFKHKNYHYDKYINCNKQNINLFMIWQDEWIYNIDIIKSMILNKLGKSNKIYARKCQIKLVNTSNTKLFLEQNHIQSYTVSKYNFGLYFNNELVSLMTFGKTRKPLGNKTNINNEYELIRFCNKLNTTVIGGASKLFKYFINTTEITNIISYSNSDKYNGNLYKQLGFKYIKDTVPNYYWVIDGIRQYRYNWRKDKLMKLGYDINKTEIKIMYEDLNSYRIFNCGSIKWLYKKDPI